MNVSLQNIDKVSALLTVKLEKADYQEKVDKSLKSFRQKAQIPGFRKGMVPMSLVKKMYGKSALAEEVNKLLSETVYKYIQDNKVNILGEPLPNEDKQQEIDFDTMEEFEFLFDIALAPEFKAEVSAKLALFFQLSKEHCLLQVTLLNAVVKVSNINVHNEIDKINIMNKTLLEGRLNNKWITTTESLQKRS
jgi:FKBP-type peptidyl-prolyl cis-trans isomerase (trigger factor)